jgi:hypothetical protein
MAIYLISFNLFRNHSHAERLDRLLAEIQVGTWWGETGSIMICESQEPIDEFCGRIFNPWTFDELCDVAVVFELESGEARSKGKFRDYSLYNIVPWVKRL